MTMTISGSSGLIFPDGSGQETGIGRNRIINGAMVIDQRNAGASVSNANGFITDRWSLSKYDPTGGSYSGQQVTDAPTGFTNSLKVTVTSSITQSADQYWQAFQTIEGYNVADLGFGTSSPSQVTVSFWVKSSVTGTYSISLYNHGVGGGARSYVTTYTINAANTWEYKTVTIAGDGASGAGYWGTTNGGGIGVYFDLGCGTNQQATANTWTATNARRVSGTVRLMATGSATWQITGVQLEVGTTATPFERRLYGQEIVLCQRYYEKSYNVGVVPGTNTNVGRCNAGGTAAGLTTGFISGNRVYYKVQKRTNSTITVYDAVGTSGVCTRFYLGVADTNGQSISVADESENGWFPYSSGSANASGIGIHWVASAEL